MVADLHPSPGATERMGRGRPLFGVGPEPLLEAGSCTAGHGGLRNSDDGLALPPRHTGAVPADLDSAVHGCHSLPGKNAILLDGLGPDGERFDVDDEETICDKPAVLAAWSCSECRLAFEQEYRLVSDDMVCTCPEDGDVIFNFNEDCSVDEAEPTFEACLEHDSSAQKEQARSCFE
jgi:hypothetical protein